MSSYYLYILALEDDYYYVGISRDVYKRYNEHISRKGAHFTRIHHPRGIVCSRELSTWSKEEAEEEETKITLIMMRCFGVERVRGGDYYQASIDDVKKSMGEKLYTAVCNDHKTADKDLLLKKYPEINYGLLLIEKKYRRIPINISTYQLWPTKSYYEKAIERMESLSDEICKTIEDGMNMLMDDSLLLENRIDAFKNMVNQMVDKRGFCEMTMTDANGNEQYYYIDEHLQ